MVLALLVGLRGLHDLVRLSEARGDELGCPLDHPVEDAGAFLLDELVGEVPDPAFLGDDVGEGDEAESAPE